jgi:hypothetical protein
MMRPRFSGRAVIAAFFLAVTAGGAARAAEKCTVAVKGDSPIAKACAKGDRGDARKKMKEMVSVAKANGQKFACENCHKDNDSFELTANARDDFKKLEAAQKK